MENKHMTKGTSLETKKSAAVEVFDPTAILAEHSGNDCIKAENCAIPFLQIASSISAVCKKSSDKFIEGITPGQIYNTVTKEFYDSLIVIPCQVKETMQAWTDEPSGKPMGDYSKTDEYVTNAKWVDGNNGSKKLKAVDGNILVETYTFLVMYIAPDGTVGHALLPMSKTKLSVAKQWNTKIKTLMIDTPKGKVNPAMYTTMYKLSTVEKSNAYGDWFIYSVNFDKLIDNKDLFESAVALSGAEVDIKAGGSEDDNVGAAVVDVESVV